MELEESPLALTEIELSSDYKSERKPALVLLYLFTYYYLSHSFLLTDFSSLYYNIS